MVPGNALVATTCSHDILSTNVYTPIPSANAANLISFKFGFGSAVQNSDYFTNVGGLAISFDEIDVIHLSSVRPTDDYIVDYFVGSVPSSPLVYKYTSLINGYVLPKFIDIYSDVYVNLVNFWTGNSQHECSHRGLNTY